MSVTKERISDERLDYLVNLYCDGDCESDESDAADVHDIHALLRELQSRRERERWIPVSECPDNTRVLFLWSNGNVEIGRMGHNVQRSGGYKKDYFWGGPFANTSDADPPTHWRPLPPIETEG